MMLNADVRKGERGVDQMRTPADMGRGRKGFSYTSFMDDPLWLLIKYFYV